jgi:hypothetical protein
VELHAEGLAVAEAAGDRWAVASAHSYLAFVSWLQRDFSRADAEAATALAMFRELGDRAFESALLATGRLQTAAGRHQAAVTVFRRAVAHEPAQRDRAPGADEQLGPAGRDGPGGPALRGADRTPAGPGRRAAGPGDHRPVPAAQHRG